MDNKTGSGDKVLDWGVVIAAMILFPKTADVLSYFSPAILNDIFGFDVYHIYGGVNALLVESLALAIHFNRRAALVGSAQVVKWALLAISGACQVFDGFVTTKTLAQQTDTMKAIFSYGVPLVPLVIMVMIFGIGQLPDNGIRSNRKPFVGLRGLWRQIMDGNGNVGKQVTGYQSETRAIKQSDNGKKPEPTNPTRPPHE